MAAVQNISGLFLRLSLFPCRQPILPVKIHPPAPYRADISGPGFLPEHSPESGAYHAAISVLIHGVTIEIAVFSIPHLGSGPVSRSNAITGTGNPEPPHFIAAAAVRQHGSLGLEYIESTGNDIEAHCSNNFVPLFQKVDNMDFVQ